MLLATSTSNQEVLPKDVLFICSTSPEIVLAATDKSKSTELISSLISSKQQQQKNLHKQKTTACEGLCLLKNITSASLN